MSSIELFFQYNKDKIINKLTKEKINDCIKNIDSEIKKIDDYRNEGYYKSFQNMKESIKAKIEYSNNKLGNLVAIEKYYRKNEKCDKCNEIGDIIALPCEKHNILHTCFKCREKFLVYFAKNFASKKSCINCEIIVPQDQEKSKISLTEHNDIYSLLKCVLIVLRDHIPSTKEPPFDDGKIACMYCGFNNDQSILKGNETCIGNVSHLFHLDCLQKEMKEQISNNKTINNMVCHYCFSSINEKLMIEAYN